MVGAPRDEDVPEDAYEWQLGNEQYNELVEARYSSPQTSRHNHQTIL